MLNRFYVLGGGGGAGSRNSNQRVGELRGSSGGGILYLHSQFTVTVDENAKIISSGEIYPFTTKIPDGGAGGKLFFLFNLFK